MTKAYKPNLSEIPSGICECGCGQPTKIATKTRRERRHFEGHPMPFLQHHAKSPSGKQHYRWKGGRYKHPSGYVFVKADHPRATRFGYIQEHRLVVEQSLNRYLDSNEAVHHINGIKDDNRLENLIVLTVSEHAAQHPNDPKRYIPTEKFREMARSQWNSLTPEERANRIQRMHGHRTKEQRSAEAKKGHEKMTPEARLERSRKGNEGRKKAAILRRSQKHN